ncbi:MAG: hypothetical protein ABEJ69_03230 [Candidatus Nanohaloarchaea archaeon]
MPLNNNIEMLRRTGTLLLVSILLVSTVAGASFGSFTSKTEKSVDGRTATYTISVLNLGSSPMEIELEPYRVDDDLTIRFDAPGDGFNSFTLPPSEVTSNPSDGKSWFLLKNGKYAETRKIKVKAFMDKARPDNIARFKVRLKAAPSTPESDYDGGQANPTQNVVQVREYSYTMETSAGRTSVEESESENSTGTFERAANFGAGLVQNFNSGFNSMVGGFTGDSSTNKPDIRVKDSGGNRQQPDTEQQFSSDTQNTGTSGGSQNKATGGFFSSVNPVTPVLLLGTLASMLYLLKVI